MSDGTRTFVASIQREDALTITVTITAPASRKDVNEFGELAQVGTLRVDSLLDKNAQLRERGDDEPPF